MIADLDPHSAFLDAEEFDEIRISTTGEYSGVGIEVALRERRRQSGHADRRHARRSVRACSPATRSSPSTTCRSIVDNLNDTIDRMRGKAGTPVKITIARSAQPDPLEFTLARATVQVHSVRKELLEPGVGYVRITHFSETTTPDLERALAALKKAERRARCTAWCSTCATIRAACSKPRSACRTCSSNDGVIVTRERPCRRREVRNGCAAGRRARRRAAGGAGERRLGLGVGDRRRRAARIIGRATLIGRQTYGKGSVQTVMPLSDGHAIKLTTSRYFTPSGASIHERGITPDVVVDEKDSRRRKATSIRPPCHGDAKDDYELQLALDLVARQGERRRRHSPESRPVTFHAAEQPAAADTQGFAARALLWLQLLTLAVGALQFAFVPDAVEHPMLAAIALALLTVSMLLVRAPCRPCSGRVSRQHWIDHRGADVCITLLAAATGAARSVLVPLYLIPLAGAALAFGRWWLVLLLAALIAALVFVLGLHRRRASTSAALSSACRC